MRNDCEQTNGGNILVECKLKEAWINVLHNKLPQLVAVFVDEACTCEKCNSFLLRSILMAKLELFDVTVLRYKSKFHQS